MCAVLVTRGIQGAEEAKRFLRPLLSELHPPELLDDARVAADRLLAAIGAGETILVHGDYDVDGMAATALYTRWLRTLGGRVVPFVPHRIRDGYDFGAAGLQAAREAEASVILTADCGIVAHEWVGRARDEGFDVLVTDHHTPGDRLPPALAVVNPARLDGAYPEASLCGTGVAFKLCSLLAREAGRPLDELLPYLDLVALATVADLVPLQGENRVLVRYGLRALAETRNPGLKALLSLLGLQGEELNAGKIGFVVAPRLNAAGRVGETRDALRLLLTDDADEARTLADGLEACNRRRQDEDRRTLDEALDLLAETYDPDRDHGVVLAADGWHPGVIGIVASRVVERIHRPVVLVALDGDRGRGSARSIPGFDLYAAVSRCSEHLGRFGGHRQAAGMDLSRGALGAFRAAFEAEARRVLRREELRPRLRVDLEASPDVFDLRTCELLAYLGPHGIGNPRPVFLARGVPLAAPPRVVGKGHLKLRLGGGAGVVEAIGFSLADGREEELARAGAVDVAFQVQINEYRGVRTPQARLLDVRPAGLADLLWGAPVTPSDEGP
jgi:single-stranded-DNA-specific exonuclease